MKDQKRFAALALSAVMVFSMAGSVSAAQKVESKDDLAGATIGVQLGTTGDLDASDYEKDGSTVESMITQSICSGIKGRTDRLCDHRFTAGSEIC